MIDKCKLDMVAVAPSRLLQPGTCALWRKGLVVWVGRIDAPFEDVDFDAITLSVEDFKRVAEAR